MSIDILPLVSIIIPCYNQAEYLDDALTSVKQQTFKDWECIIINDGSLDDCELVARVWCNQDTRYKYIHQRNQGLSSARNMGVRNAKGKYILPLDADDMIGSEYLEKAVKIMESGCVKLVYCKAKKFGSVNIDWILPNYSYERLLVENPIFCSAIYKRADYLKTKGYDENMTQGYEDWDYWLQLLELGDQVKRIETTEFFYRIKKESMLQNIDEKISRDLRNYIFKKHIDKYLVSWDPIFEKKNFNKLSSMYIKSIDYRLGNLIVNPFRRLYNFIKHNN